MKFNLISYSILFSFLFSSALAANECRQVSEDLSRYNVKVECLEDNKVVVETVSSKSKNEILFIKTFRNFKIIKNAIFMRGNLSREHYWVYEGEKTILRTLTYPGGYLSHHSEKVGDRVVMAKRFDPKTNNEICSEYYDEQNRVIKRIDSSNKDIVNYIYKDDSKEARAFQIYNSNGELKSDYDIDRVFDLQEIYGDLSDEEYMSRLEHFNKVDRVKVAIIDSGVDIYHKDLAYKMWNNPDDILDGVDNDGNGLIDDIMGWGEPIKSGFPIETISVKNLVRPLSHGTHVASIASRGLEDVAIMSFGGDFGEASFLNIMGKELKSKKVEFANMSFTFPHWQTDMFPKSSLDALKKMISSNPETLFFAASGNDGRRIGSGVRDGAFPAGYSYSNIVTVSALETDELIESKMHTYKMADFSNFSIIHSDIFAPGDYVNGASLGGGMIRHSGTSMASPYALRETMNIKIAYPELTGPQLKEIIIKSAYIPNIDKPMLVSSGGMIFPRRAMEVAKRVVLSSLGIEDVCLEIRMEEEFLLEGEKANREYLDKVKALWAQRL